MKKIVHNLKNGKTKIITSPIPALKSGHILIKSEYSIISLGTEKMLVDFGKANFLKKAKLQPDKLNKALDKIKTDGIIPTFNSIINKLNKPMPLGYSNAGIVHGIGANVKGFKIGDRVISNGPHSDYFNVPVNLCAKIPKNVSTKEASFTVLGSISLQSVRLLKPLIGETIYVFGMGVIGLIVAQILISNGCKVIAIDYKEERLIKSKHYGATTIKLDKNIDLKNFEEADGVIIATNTKSNEPLDIATSISRKRGRIILVGDSGLNVNRTEFYKKELSFQVSRSYGPGRYDSLYEEDGIDYPIEYVRWTEKRNFETILNLLESNKLSFSSLISHQLNLDQAINFYENIDKNESLGVLIEYSKKNNDERVISNVNHKCKNTPNNKTNTGFIGAGNYCTALLLPAFKKTKTNLIGISSQNGINAAITSKKFNFKYCTSDNKKILEDKNINNVVITTQHDTHFELAKEAFLKNKNVFVEKPLCLTISDLDNLNAVITKENKNENFLTVGFNRRFSPLTKILKDRMALIKKPKMILITVNAGYIEDDHWTQKKLKGGGRLIGEGIHFIDIARFLCGVDIVNWKCSPGIGSSKDTFSIILEFEDDSIANINYISNGSSLYPKEKITVFCDQKIAEINNFKRIEFFNWPNSRNKSLFIQNKGQNECVKTFIKTCEGNLKPPIPYDELYQTHNVALQIMNYIG